MSESNFRILEYDTRDFIMSLGDFFRASPNENQYIIGEILNQILEGARLRGIEHLKGEHGYELIVVLEASGSRVAKRVFHPGDVQGVDFAISKLQNREYIVNSVVQVKRNRGQQFFAFDTRELTQLRNISRWPSSYYLMIDETTKPPSSCFILTSEIASMIRMRTRRRFTRRLKSVRIPNDLVRKYCRGTRMFYKSFYDCRRGSRRKIQEFFEFSSKYTTETMRVLVEILVQSKYEVRR